VLIDVVPDIPFIATRNAALMTPNETKIFKELVDIELKRL
jgi:hypothetical protein